MNDYNEILNVIEKDDIQSLKNIFAQKEKKEFFKHYQEFLEKTYPKSIQSLSFLISLNEIFQCRNLIQKGLKENNEKWIVQLFESLTELKNQRIEKQNNSSNVFKNITFIISEFDYQSFIDSSPKMWKVLFPYIRNYSHMIVNTIFEKENYEKLKQLEDICEFYQQEIPIKSILEQSFMYDKLDIALHYQKYLKQYEKKQDDRTDLINSIGLSGSIKAFDFFQKEIVDVNKFTDNEKALLFNGSLLTNYTQLSEHLIENYQFHFYPQDKKLLKEFLDVRKTIWEDNDYDLLSAKKLIILVNNWFNKYHWDKSLLKKEIKDFPNLTKILSTIIFNKSLEKELSTKNLTTKLKL